MGVNRHIAKALIEWVASEVKSYMTDLIVDSDTIDTGDITRLIRTSSDTSNWQTPTYSVLNFPIMLDDMSCHGAAGDEFVIEEEGQIVDVQAEGLQGICFNVLANSKSGHLPVDFPL